MDQDGRNKRFKKLSVLIEQFSIRKAKFQKKLQENKAVKFLNIKIIKPIKTFTGLIFRPIKNVFGILASKFVIRSPSARELIRGVTLPIIFLVLGVPYLEAAREKMKDRDFSQKNNIDKITLSEDILSQMDEVRASSVSPVLPPEVDGLGIEANCDTFGSSVVYHESIVVSNKPRHLKSIQDLYTGDERELGPKEREQILNNMIVDGKLKANTNGNNFQISSSKTHTLRGGERGYHRAPLFKSLGLTAYEAIHSDLGQEYDSVTAKYSKGFTRFSVPDIEQLVVAEFNCNAARQDNPASCRITFNDHNGEEQVFHYQEIAKQVVLTLETADGTEHQCSYDPKQNLNHVLKRGGLTVPTF